MRELLRAGTEWNWVSDPTSAAAAGVPYPYPGFAGTAWMAITPYPQAAAGWGPLFFVGSPLGQTDYHALQLTASRRAASGVIASVSYTVSRQRGNVETEFQERWKSGPLQDVTRRDQGPGHRRQRPHAHRQGVHRVVGEGLDRQRDRPLRVRAAAHRPIVERVRRVVLLDLRQPQCAGAT